jgi:anti-sigma factor RsiW
MDCLDKKKISAYLDGELPEDDRTAFRDHLDGCAACRAEAEELAAVTDALDVLGGLEPDPYFAARVKRIALTRKQNGLLKRAIVPAAATAAAALSLLLGGFLGQALYAGWAGDSAEAETEFAEYMGTTAIEDFPVGSLGEVLSEIPVEGGNS